MTTRKQRCIEVVATAASAYGIRWVVRFDRWFGTKLSAWVIHRATQRYYAKNKP